MSFVSQFIRNQSKALLANYRHALMCALVFILTPFTTWISLAVIGLVTLRRGYKEGGLLLLPVVLAHFALSLTSVGWIPAVFNTALTFIPCYMAAIVLRYTMSWQIVMAFFLVEMVVIALCLQIGMPDFITAQYVYLQTVIRQLHPSDALVDLVSDKGALNQLMIANYLFGLQMLAVSLSAVMALMTSRLMQSNLYYPGGFKQEMLSFRGNKLALVLLMVVLFAANQKNVLAINLLPALVVYFLFAGLSLSFQIFANKKMLSAVILLMLPLVFLPFIMLPVYVILGSLDSLINFRVYLRTNAGKTT